MIFKDDSDVIIEDDTKQNIDDVELYHLSKMNDNGPSGAVWEDIKRAKLKLSQIEHVLADREIQMEELKNERSTISRLEDDIRNLKSHIESNGQSSLDTNKSKRLDLKIKRSQKAPFKRRQSLTGLGVSLARQYSRLDANNTETFAEFALRMKRENRPLVNFDNDTFSLMMMHRAVSYEWLFGWFVIAFVWMFMILILRDAVQQANETGTPLGTCLIFRIIRLMLGFAC